MFPVLYRKFSWVQFIECIVNPFNDLSISSFLFITPIRTLWITNTKQRSFNSLLKTKESLYGGHCCRSWFGTMASSRPPNSAVHRTRVKQRGSCGKPEVATVLLAQGVFGGERHTRKETEGEQSNAEEFPKTLTPCASIHRDHACTWTCSFVHTTLSISCPTVSLWDLSVQFSSNLEFYFLPPHA